MNEEQVKSFAKLCDAGLVKPYEKVFSFNDFISALESQESPASLEPFDKLVESLKDKLGVE